MKDNTRYHAKLTPEQIWQIKSYLLESGGAKQEWIARKFGVSQLTICYYNKQLKKEVQSIANL